jgi:ABC-2 type transport system permease protein
MPGAHFSVAGSLLLALGLVSGAAMFLAIGALTSQLSATRGQAATLAAAILGASFAIRLVADSRTSLTWLLWLSPLGWVEELRPLQSPQPVALGLMVGLTIACAGLAVLLAGRRDLNASVLREGESGPGNVRGLVGPISLAIRVSGPNALAWLGGVAAMGWIYGSLTRAASSIMTGSPAIAVALGRLGVREATRGYLGIVFLFAEILIAVIAAGQIGAIRDEEAAGRLDNLLVRPVLRTTWLASRLVFSLSILVLGAIAAGFFTWLGALDQHTGVSLPTLLEAGLNATVPAVFVLGAGVLVFGIRPRFSSVAAYGIVAWSLLVDLLGSLVKGSDWLKDSSLFTHVALAPAANPDWGAAAIIIALGVAGAIVGAIAFQGRDVEYA